MYVPCTPLLERAGIRALASCFCLFSELGLLQRGSLLNILNVIAYQRLCVFAHNSMAISHSAGVIRKCLCLPVTLPLSC